MEGKGRIDVQLRRDIEEQFEHLENHDDGNWYRCRVCDEKYYFGRTRPDDLLEHLNSHE